MLTFTRKLTAASALRYATWRLTGSRAPVKLTLRTGPHFELRPHIPGSFENNDYGVAYEVFVFDHYNDRAEQIPRRIPLIVDLGANVGFSLLYFLHKYPACRIIAFEPHPRHYAQAIRNLALDGTRDRVELRAQAAGASNRALWLSDQGTSSSLSKKEASGGIRAEVVDIFPILEGRHIDLLKMDIEGGEYEILGDDRFGTLDIAAIVMEWHARGRGLNDKRWCQARLRGLGYAIEEVFAEPRNGLFWAKRSLPPDSSK